MIHTTIFILFHFSKVTLIYLSFFNKEEKCVEKNGSPAPLSTGVGEVGTYNSAANNGALPHLVCFMIQRRVSNGANIESSDEP